MSDLRIIWAITTKDMVDAVRNRNTLSVILVVLLAVVFYRALPLLESEDAPGILVYDAGRSALAVALENSDAVNARTEPTQAQMADALANHEAPELGLVIPADFDQAVAAGGSLKLQGYVMHWVSDSEAAALKRAAEATIGEVMGASVRITVERVYLRPTSQGMSTSVAYTLFFVVLVVGVSLIPNLMFEEKRARTLDALLVSPASAGQVAIAKALTGVLYCVLGLAVACVVNYTVIVQWWLVILAALGGALFAAAVGLLLGTLLESRQQLMIWVWVVIIPLTIPLFLSLEQELLPAWLIRVFGMLPSSALFDLFRVSFTDQAAFGLWGPSLALLVLWTAPLLALVAWCIRRSDR